LSRDDIEELVVPETRGKTGKKSVSNGAYKQKYLHIPSTSGKGNLQMKKKLRIFY
jgi:hypothetical protein